jgi:hypothetical protein
MKKKKQYDKPVLGAKKIEVGVYGNYSMEPPPSKTSTETHKESIHPFAPE